jgi:DNA polymerase (family X)
MMTNSFIADQFALLSKLTEVHQGNAFKAKSYATAAFNIDKLPTALADMQPSKLPSLKGIGESVAQKIIEIIQTGQLQVLVDIVNKTPIGVLEMLTIKGIGPKKIATIWKEMGIESLGELLYACNENRLTLYKGFGQKTQQNIQEAIAFYCKNQGSYLYAEAAVMAIGIEKWLVDIFDESSVRLTGAVRQQENIITQFEFVVHYPTQIIIEKLKDYKELIIAANNDTSVVACKHADGYTLQLYACEEEYRDERLFFTSGTPAFTQAFDHNFPNIAYSGCSDKDDKEIFAQAGIDYIPSFYRVSPDSITEAKEKKLPAFIQPNDIKGIIHSHSNWSDGQDTLEAMALACVANGYEYLVISDHSKSAFYANGLEEVRIEAQHQYINELNKKLSPFKIFKSIECDILNDGLLDYNDTILASFDLVIASIHTNLKMPEEKAMQRLLAAIANPYTTILGHLTGRLLLSRKGYPVNHQTIIEACAKHQVAIELNAHPRRLDIDWCYIKEAVQQNVLISINPDAHTIAGFKDCYYGVLSAQKAGLTAANNLSSFTLVQLEAYLKKRKTAKGI